MQIKFTGDMLKAAKTTPRSGRKPQRSKYEPHYGKKQLRKSIEAHEAATA